MHASVALAYNMWVSIIQIQGSNTWPTTFIVVKVRNQVDSATT